MNTSRFIGERSRSYLRARFITIATFAFALAYGGGLWLHLLHEADDAIELDAPPSLIHWLRDSTLMLPLVIASVIIALLLTERILKRSAHKSSRLMSDAITVALIALITSAAIDIASPIHNLMFDATHHVGDEEMPVLAHILFDGTLALIANFFIAAIVMTLMRATPLWRAPRRVVTPKAFMQLNRLMPLAALTVALCLTVTFAPIRNFSFAPTTAQAAALAPTCRAISADVVALDQTIVYNRLGAIDPEGMIFALRQDVVDKTSNKT